MMNTTPPVIGLGFTRAVGKDTLAGLMHKVDPRVRPYAFAAPLKQDLEPLFWSRFGIDIWTCSAEEKEIVRPILIAYGMAQRVRDPDYWVKRTVASIKRDLELGFDILPVITDVRFTNEVDILRRELGAIIVHVARNGAPEPTDEEKKHYASLIPMADHHVVWGNDTPEDQLDMAREVLRWVKS